jgi:hypothetical protein
MYAKRLFRQGFVLVMTLAVITLVGMILVGLARHSLSVSSAAADCTQSLQQRWGATSLKHALLEGANDIMTLRNGSTSGDRNGFSEPVRAIVRLGDMSFHVVLSDENTKINVNDIERRDGKDGVMSVLQEMEASAQHVRWRPYQRSARTASHPAFDSWGQLFELDRLPNKTHPATWLMSNSRHITCWGDGTVNFHRASDKVLERAIELATSRKSALEIVAVRDRGPDLSLDQVLVRLRLSQKSQRELRRWLGEESACFSLWLIAETKARKTHQLAVAEESSSGSIHISTFRW